MSLEPSDVATVTQLVQRLVGESFRNLARGSGTAALSIPVTRTATVASHVLPDEAGSVRCDGDLTAIGVQNATGRFITAGSRVLVSFLPPHGAFIVGAIGSTFADEVLIQGDTLQASAASVVINNIPQEFHYLRLIGSFRTDAGSDQELWMRVNNDASNVYYIAYHHVDGAGAISAGMGSTTQWAIAPALGPPTDVGFWGFCDLRLTDYNDGSLVKRPNMRCERGQWASIGNAMSTLQGVYNTTPTPITSIQLMCSSGNINLGSSYALYGCGRRLDQ